jgi:hypothetical protein
MIYSSTILSHIDHLHDRFEEFEPHLNISYALSDVHPL